MSEKNTPDVNLNLNVRGLPVSATLEINERSNFLRAEGKKIYKLGLGQSPFPVPQPVVDKLKVNAYQKDYLPVKGLRELRESVADYYRRKQGLEMSFEDVIIGPGSKELMFILQLVYYGDLVIPTPSWVSYAPQAHIIGHHVQWLKTVEENDWLLMPDELENLCKEDPNKPRIVILNYPNNPTGETYSEEQMKDLAEVARKYKLVLLSDEIYGELDHEGKHISIAKFYPEGTIISSGLSKWCGAGGWRLGTFAFPRELRWLLDSISVVASETFTSTSAPIQYAAVRAFEGGMKIERYLWNSRKILRELGGEIYKKLKDADISVPFPRGGFYMFPNMKNQKDKLSVRGIASSTDMCKKMLVDTGVATLPGTSFGRPEHELTLRFAYVDFDGAAALAAAEQVAPEDALGIDYLKQYCGDVLEAIDIMCQWVNK